MGPNPAVGHLQGVPSWRISCTGPLEYIYWEKSIGIVTNKASGVYPVRKRIATQEKIVTDHQCIHNLLFVKNDWQ